MNLLSTSRGTPPTSSTTSRRVSFQDDIVVRGRRRCVGLTRSAATTSTTKTSSQHRQHQQQPSSILKKSVTVLHGRVVKQDNSNNGDCDTISDSYSDRDHHHHRKSKGKGNLPSAIRDSMERKSTFYQLTEETQQFQKQIATLESVIREYHQKQQQQQQQDSTTTEAAWWRVRALLKSAQDTDQQLWTKLYEFEKTLLSKDAAVATAQQQDDDDTAIRSTQTACMKLHRDFKHSHKALLMCLSLVEATTTTTSTTTTGPHQNNHNSTVMLMTDKTATTSHSNSLSLGGVGWTNHSGKVGDDDTEHADEMRQEMDGSSPWTSGDGTTARHENKNMQLQLLLDRQRSPDVMYTSFREVHRKHPKGHLYPNEMDGGGSSPKSVVPGSEFRDDTLSSSRRSMVDLESLSHGREQRGSGSWRYTTTTSHRNGGAANHSENDDYLCGVFDLNGHDDDDDDDSVVYKKSDLYHRFYAHFKRELKYVVQVGQNLGCTTTNSRSNSFFFNNNNNDPDDNIMSSRYNSRQASF